MTIKKREEIIKALECWTSEYGCKGCPFIEQGCFDCGHIPIEVSKSILALIKELTEENEVFGRELKSYFDNAWTRESDLVHKMQTMIKEECIAGGIYPAFVARVVENVGKKLLEEKE